MKKINNLKRKKKEIRWGRVFWIVFGESAEEVGEKGKVTSEKKQHRREPGKQR